MGHLVGHGATERPSGEEIGAGLLNRAHRLQIVGGHAPDVAGGILTTVEPPCLQPVEGLLGAEET